jgi:serine/threonine-protein kinase
LPPELARDPQRLARFRREAHTLASLNHPNIAAIYGLKESADIRFLVLELVEGDTLRGRLPLVTELDRARQVANMRGARVVFFSYRSWKKPAAFSRRTRPVTFSQ